jgi:hypothetical protein
MGLSVGVAGALGLIALAGIAAGAEPAYDPWAWLVWGEEVSRLDLDTTAGPSWKPLPVAIAALLSLAGEFSPHLWLIVAWAGFIAAPLAAGALALRLRGGRAAAALAALGTILLYDEVTPWLRQGYGGLTEPLLVALVLGAIERAVAGRHRVAALLAAAACLLRPEAWPFALAYAVWLAWRGSRGRLAGAAVALAALAVAAAWFVPDLLAAGNAFEGAGRARAGEGEEFGDVGDVLWRAIQMPSTVLLLAAALLAWRGSRTERLLLAGAAAWIALVVALAAAGYAGLPRFMAPAAALLTTLGAANLPRLLAERQVDPTYRGQLDARLVGGVVVAVALVGDLGWRAGLVPGDLEEARDRSAAIADVRGVVEDAGVERVLECAPAPVSIATTHLTAQTVLAWELGVPIERVQVHSDGGGLAVILAGPDSNVPDAAREALLAERGEWALLGPGC